MSFSRKVFIAMFGSTLFVCTALIWIAHHFIGERNRQEYLARYTSTSQILGNSITQLERNTESLMFDAAEVVAGEDQKKGLLSNEALKILRTKLNITHLFTIDKSGTFIRSTNENPKLIPNLYSFCGDYKELFNGNGGKRITPIIPPKPEPESFKFLTIPNYNKTRLIHVGMRVDFLQTALSSALADDPNILELNIYAPDGSSLGRFNKNGVNLQHSKILLPESIDSVSQNKGEFKILTKIESPQTHCCQCDVAGISKAGNYYYVIESVVSDKELIAVQASMRNLFLILQVIALFFAFFAAKWLSKKLVERVELVTKSISRMGNEDDSGARINISGKDEIKYLANEFNGLLDRLENSKKRLVDSQSKAAIGDMAREVAHNINSPLLSMQNAMRSIKGSDESVRMLRNAVNEIKDHLGALKLKSGIEIEPEETNSANPSHRILRPRDYLLSAILEDIISEKKLQNKSRSDLHIELKINPHAKNKFARFDLTEFRSVISNLINNSAESIVGVGKIAIHYSCVDDKLFIAIEDNGTGIGPEVLPKIFLRDFTFGKKTGSGLGLSHAKTQVENFGGAVKVTSSVGAGTVVTVEMPCVPAPEWFIPSLDFSSCHSLVVIDDSISLHDLWRSKVKNQKFYSFSRVTEFEKWFASKEAKSLGETVYLVDYDLNDSISGLDLIEKYSIAGRSVLVTTEFDDEAMLARANWVGVKVMPKAVL
jgi:signal transduction histidine kinase